VSRRHQQQELGARDEEKRQQKQKQARNFLVLRTITHHPLLLLYAH
jgi:hypothetical protein